MLLQIATLATLILLQLGTTAQDTLSKPISAKFAGKVADKAEALEEKLDKKSQKALRELAKQEEKIKRKLVSLDSNEAKKVFADAESKYKALESRLNGATSTPYISNLDSLSVSLKFLKDNPQLIEKGKEVKEKLTNAVAKINGLEGQFGKAEEIRKFLKERKQFLKEQLSKFGFAKELKKFNKQVYYYSQQINEYKEILKDPKKIEKKTLELLSKTKLWKDFFRRNSMLATLFRMPGDPADPVYLASLAGLQTRSQVNSLIQQQLSAGGPGAQQQFRQNIQAAQSQLNELKNKITNLGGGGSDADLPEGFRPNNQKTKSFLDRLEFGSNIQSQKSTSFFPTTTDIGLSLGYKPNDKSIIGVGASYKLGLGRGWNNLRLSHEGIGLRSFVDVKLKGSLWISGGYEQNYRAAFRDFSQLRDMSGWQQSGLIGLSKTIPVKSKFFKKTSIKILWDFLSSQQIPRTQPVIFRLGYNF